MPNATSSAFSASGFTRPLKRDIIASAGLPGISRGMKKFRVSAAQRVTKKKPSRRSTYLIAVPPRVVPVGHGSATDRDGVTCPAHVYFGSSLSSTCSRSGRLYGAGSAYGSCSVGQPVKTWC